ncbi:MAG TPA: DUF192 domain-containing protein [Acidimicrobiales bacterium]|nr:DUF192 domain-containing protein [Acidimicrobiales bacterium]
MKRLAAVLDTEGGVRFLWWLIGATLIVGFFVYLAVGANGPKDPKVAAREGVGGFDTIGFSIEHGAVNDVWCALLAGNDKQRQTGMMGRTDLGGLDAMLFAFPAPVDNRLVYFYNRRVPIALSVAWFDPGGKYLSATDMESCADIPDCPRFTTTSKFKFAIEVPKGGLGRLGIGPGAVLDVGKSGC